MYPFFDLFDGFIVYTFGLTLTFSFFVFLWMLKKLSLKFGFDFLLFRQNIAWFFLSIFLFSRLFYVLSKWSDLKYIKDPFEFFIMSDYNFSLFGAVFGFFFVMFILLKLRNESIIKYIDGVVLSFFLVLCIGFMGTLLGGQVYGRETTFGIEILYNNPFTPVPYQVPIFPLPIVYTIVFFIGFSVLYILSMYVHIKGFIGYIGMIAFSCIILIFEFFSGKYDMVRLYFPFNINQIFALILLLTAAYGLVMLTKSHEGKSYF